MRLVLWVLIFQMSLDQPILNIFLHEKKQEKAQILYFPNFEKKIFFKRLQNVCLKKKAPTNQKIAKNHDFLTLRL